MSEEADVCMLLEGTFPYVPGGVSSWVHQAIVGMPDLTFSLFFIGSEGDQYDGYAYEIPPNVIKIEECHIFDKFRELELDEGRAKKNVRAEFHKLFQSFFLSPGHDVAIKRFFEIVDLLEQHYEDYTFADVYKDSDAWNVLVEICSHYFPNESFVDLYYSSQFIVAPLWKLLKAIPNVPKAKCYYTLCTGYAGMVGACVSRRTGSPLILSEHGVYVKERIADISQADWIYEKMSDHIDLRQGLGFLKKLWIEKFKFLGRLTYKESKKITTLYSGNLKLQVHFGANPSKIVTIPNGIYVHECDKQLKERMGRLENEDPKIIGFIGRVVSIKDVKNLIRAMSMVLRKVPQAVLHIMGPYEEEMDYYEQCVELVEAMGLKEHVIFRGRCNIKEVISSLDVLVLTSISEGLPFVILEAYAAGIPCVATDVGACRELIFGVTPDDRATGVGGVLTRIATPDQTAAGLISLLTDKEKLLTLGMNGRKRAELFYRQDDVFKNYRKLYQEYSK